MGNASTMDGLLPLEACQNVIQISDMEIWPEWWQQHVFQLAIQHPF